MKTKRKTIQKRTVKNYSVKRGEARELSFHIINENDEPVRKELPTDIKLLTE